jgi:hypothetical protein
MPDEDGLLSKADNDSIQRWWDLHWQDPVICPVCKKNRLVPHSPPGKCSEICDGCERKQSACLSAYHNHLQILRAFYVFQCRTNWYRRAIRSATRSRLGHQRERNGTGEHSWTTTELDGFN